MVLRLFRLSRTFSEILAWSTFYDLTPPFNTLDLPTKSDLSQQLPKAAASYGMTIPVDYFRHWKESVCAHFSQLAISASTNKA